MRSNAARVLLGLSVFPFCLLAVGLLAGNCGGGGEKQAFRDYEANVDPILTKDAEIRARFEEKVGDVSVFGDDESFNALITGVMVPFYDEMAESVGAIVPEGEKLIEIHGILVNYVRLRQEMFAAYVELDGVAKETAVAERPANETVERAKMTVREKGELLRDALGRAPAETTNALLPLFKDEAMVGKRLLESLEALRRNDVESAAFVELLDQGVSPFYADLDKKVGLIPVAEEGKPLIAATKAYIAAIGGIVAAARELALVRSQSEGRISALQDRFEGAQNGGLETLESYRREAKRYRDSMR